MATSTRSNPKSFQQLIDDKKLVICVGAGGVGKTSMAAAIGVRAACDGKKVLVLTIDPAKRLANSLGLSRFGNDEAQIDLSTIAEVTECKEGGELWAMMLDGQHVFIELINRVAKDNETRDAILSNNIFQSIAETIVGNQEYMATEKLYDVVSGDRYDLIILDTPPVKNALDFLDSPGRMARFVDERIMKWFLSPYDEKTIFSRIVSTTSSVIFRLLAYIFGKDFVSEISLFFQSFTDLYEGFQQRHQAVENLFRSTDTIFTIVCAPNGPATEVAHFFISELNKRKMNIGGVVVNQCHVTSEFALDPAPLLRRVLSDDHSELSTPERLLTARMKSAHRRLRHLSIYENRLSVMIKERLSEAQGLWHVARLQGEVHDLQALVKVGEILFEESSV